MPTERTAPVYLDLFRIRLPASAVTSIAHRVSGALLFLSLPLFVYLLDLSLRGPAGFGQAVDILSGGWAKAASVVIAWSVLHHLVAGIRFLLIDIGVGVDLPAARRSARAVHLAVAVLTLAWLGWIL